jgi:hypothetical protein
MFKKSRPAVLTQQDVQEVERLLNNAIADYNPRQEQKYEVMRKQYPQKNILKHEFIIQLEYYGRQYVAMFNEKGEKEVWINCFCSALDSDWKKEIISVSDGGNCFFQVTVNLTQGRYVDLYVHGEG